MRHAYSYLDKAVDAMKIERLKLVACFFIQSLHVSLIGHKPFNPIIGETFQASFTPTTGDSDNTLDFYVEQTSHHPPILNYYGKHKNYTIYGHRESSAYGTGNSVVAEIKGPFNIKFSDGTHIVTHYPKFVMNGLVFGKKLFGYEGNFVIEDKTNNLTCILNINPKQSKGFFGGIFGKTTKNFPDYFNGFIASSHDIEFDKKTSTYNIAKEAILSKIEGEYNVHCTIDDKCYWDINESNPSTMYRQSFTLPSDSQYRYDVILYRNNKFEMAQYAKMTLEDLQRKDTKLRKKYEKVDEKKVKK